MKEYNYLTEDELEALIKSAENDQVDAPADLLAEIMSLLEEEEKCFESDTDKEKMTEPDHEIQKPPQIIDMNTRKAEFRRYCIRVITSAAAAIILIFTVPALVGSGDTSIPDKQTVLSENYLSKDEVAKKKECSIMRKAGESHRLTELYDQWKD